jgi:hypothetical protein
MKFTLLRRFTTTIRYLSDTLERHRKPSESIRKARTPIAAGQR